MDSSCQIVPFQCVLIVRIRFYNKAFVCNVMAQGAEWECRRLSMLGCGSRSTNNGQQDVGPPLRDTTECPIRQIPAG